MRWPACLLFAYISVGAAALQQIPFEEHRISNNLQGAQKIEIVDMDGDRDLDVLSAGDKLIWWENDGRGRFMEHVVADDVGTIIHAVGSDLDRDGDIDILAACYKAGSVCWWENDGRQAFARRDVSTSFSGAHDVAVADVDGDGCLDVVGARGKESGEGEVCWWRNLGDERFSKEVLYQGDFSHSVSTADLNGDGRLDILATQFNEGIRLWFQDKELRFRERFFPLTGAHLVHVTDVNADGRPDILGVGYAEGQLILWRNRGEEDFETVEVARAFLGAVTVTTADLDQDGDVDILAGGEQAHDIAWWENDGGTFRQHSIAGWLANASGVAAGDLDGDGDLDVAGTTWRSTNEVTWWENRGTSREVVVGSERQFLALVRNSGLDAARRRLPEDRVLLQETSLTGLGSVFIRQERLDDAISLLRFSVEKFPDSSDVYQGLGEAYEFKPDLEQAEKCYAKAMEVASDASHPDVSRFEDSLSGVRDRNRWEALLQDFPHLSGPYLGQMPPSDEPRRFAPDIFFNVFSRALHHELHGCPAFSPDGRTVLIEVQSRQPHSRRYETTVLMLTEESGRWSGPKRAPFCGKHNDGGPAFSPDGRRIYFSSERPRPGTSSQDKDIWYVEKTAGGWSEPRALGPTINTPANEGAVSFSDDGTLYFYCRLEPDQGSGEIYRAKWQGGEFVQISKLPAPINTEHFECFPTIAPDESWLVFYSMGRQSGTGQYRSVRRPDGSWSEPTLLGPQLNAGGLAFCTRLSPDGKYMFYLLRRVDQLPISGDPRPAGIYWLRKW